MDRTDDEHPRPTTTGGRQDGGVRQPLRPQSGGEDSAVPGQVSLFLVGTLLFVVGLGVVVGLSGVGDVAPEGPIVNETDTLEPDETATDAGAADEGTESPGGDTATTQGPTATPSPTEEDDGGLFGGDDDTPTPTPEPDGDTPTPTEDDGVIDIGGDETDSPTRSPSATPTPSETPTDSSYSTPSETPTQTESDDTPTTTDTATDSDDTPTSSTSESFSAAMTGLWSVLGELTRLLAVGLLSLVTLVRRA